MDLLNNEELPNNRFIALSDKLNSIPKDVIYANPHYFGNVKITKKSKKITNFIVVGVISQERKNYVLLKDTVKKLIMNGETNFHITIIGLSKIEIPVKYRKYFTVLGRVSYDVLFRELENADFYLPLLDIEIPEHERYIDNGTSGSFQLIYGFCKPCVIQKTFADVYGFNSSDSIVYDINNDLFDAVKKAIYMNNGEYDSLQKY